MSDKIKILLAEDEMALGTNTRLMVPPCFSMIFLGLKEYKQQELQQRIMINLRQE